MDACGRCQSVQKLLRREAVHTIMAMQKTTVYYRCLMKRRVCRYAVLIFI